MQGLTPENGLSPNEIIFPLRIPMTADDDDERQNDVIKYEGSVDSMAVLE